jgi:hypothetical protein
VQRIRGDLGGRNVNTEGVNNTSTNHEANAGQRGVKRITFGDVERFARRVKTREGDLTCVGLTECVVKCGTEAANPVERGKFMMSAKERALYDWFEVNGDRAEFDWEMCARREVDAPSVLVKMRTELLALRVMYLMPGLTHENLCWVRHHKPVHYATVRAYARIVRIIEAQPTLVEPVEETIVLDDDGVISRLRQLAITDDDVEMQDGALDALSDEHRVVIIDPNEQLMRTHGIRITIPKIGLIVELGATGSQGCVMLRIVRSWLDLVKSPGELIANMVAEGHLLCTATKKGKGIRMNSRNSVRRWLCSKKIVKWQYTTYTK